MLYRRAEPAYDRELGIRTALRPCLAEFGKVLVAKFGVQADILEDELSRTISYSLSKSGNVGALAK